MPIATFVSQSDNSDWKDLYRIGGVTALIAVLIAPAEVVINFLPGVAKATASTVTVAEWFTLLQDNPLLGLRNLGLLNLCGAALLAPSFLAVFSALRRDHESFATFGTILFFVGIAVYLSGNRAFPLLSLSRQYAAAATDAQQSLLLSAGQAMLTEGQSRAGILLIEFSGLFLSVIMLRGNVFDRVTACTGVLGNSLMMVVETFFVPPHGAGMVFAASGGLSIVTWYLLMGRRLLQLGR